MNYFSITIQINPIICFAIIQLQVIISQQQQIVLSKSISIEFGLQWKNHS